MPARVAPLRLPTRGDIAAAGPALAGVGVIDLGRNGLAVVAAASTVNFALRTEVEQHALVGCFARLLHAVPGPVQILIRAQRLDLDPALAQLAGATARLPHPALRAAAADHYLPELAATELLARQVLVVLREPPGPGRAPGPANRLVQRLGGGTALPGPGGDHRDPGGARPPRTPCSPRRATPTGRCRRPVGMAAPDQIISTALGLPPGAGHAAHPPCESVTEQPPETQAVQVPQQSKGRAQRRRQVRLTDHDRDTSSVRTDPAQRSGSTQ
jgi:hypothetical protein